MKIYVRMTVMAVVMLVMASCSSTKDVQYMQDFDEKYLQQSVGNQGIIIESGDMLSIIVSTKDPELGAIFNIQPGVTGGTSSSATGVNSEVGYRVDPEGNITFPTLGVLHVAGMTRLDLENMIRQRILKDGLLKEFSVNVSFLNFKISVLGDVKSPGNYDIKDDKYTVLQALADAGDLNITAMREIYVVREKGGIRQIYKVDLRSKDLFDSPAYYLQQNDIIYVLPNGKKVSERDSNNFRNISMWTSLGSISVSLATLIVTLIRR